MPDEEHEEPEEVDEKELIAAARGGDQRAFGSLVERYQNRLFRFILERIGNREDAEDVLQITFVTAYRNLAAYRDKYRFSTWLYTLAYRRTVDRMRQRRNIPAEATTDRLVDAHPAASMEAEEVHDRLWGLARRVLSDRQHTLLWLRYGEDLDLGEIASVTGLSRTHIKVLLYRARQILARHLATLKDEQLMPHRNSSAQRTEQAWSRHPMMEKS